MNAEFFSSLLEHYNWQLSLITLVAVLGLPFILGKLVQVVPAFKEAAKMNKETFDKKMQIPRYKANQKLNHVWGAVYMAVIFGLIMPFVLTADAQPIWSMLVDMVVILLVYDFFYYLAHRFLFHDAGFFKGPLIWVHAVHHQQHNPCRGDSSYIHPLEVAIGLGLYVATIFGLSRVMGEFHVATIIVTWIAFSEINLHNHDLWKADKFPFRYLKYMSDMHHHHHAKFTGGNYATISLLYDWMFGTIDHGDGYGKKAKVAKEA